MQEDEHNRAIIDWKRVREAIAHEDNLTNYRLGWLFASQAFLFTAFAVAFKVLEDKDFQFQRDLILILVIIPTIGIPIISILVSFYIWFQVRIGGAQHKELIKWWNNKYGEKIPEKNQHPKICGQPKRGQKKLHKILALHVLPGVFFISWLIVLVTVCLVIYQHSA